MVYSYDRREAARPIPLDRSLVERLVRDTLKRLPPHLHFRGGSDVPLKDQRGFNPNTWGFDIPDVETTDVQGHRVWVGVSVRADRTEDWRGPRRYVKGGNVKAEYQRGPSGRPVGYGTKTSLIVEFNSERTPRELQESPQVAQELASVFSHELTHLRDLLTYQGPTEDSEAGTKEYYNRPTEVRAFLRQISEEALEYTHSVGKDDPFFLHLDSRFIDLALEQSGTWDRIRNHLTEPNRRLILRGVTRVLQDAWPELEKLYPQEDES